MNAKCLVCKFTKQMTATINVEDLQMKHSDVVRRNLNETTKHKICFWLRIITEREGVLADMYINTHLNTYTHSKCNTHNVRMCICRKITKMNMDMHSYNMKGKTCTWKCLLIIIWCGGSFFLPKIYCSYCLALHEIRSGCCFGRSRTEIFQNLLFKKGRTRWSLCGTFSVMHLSKCGKIIISNRFFFVLFRFALRDLFLSNGSLGLILRISHILFI